MTIFDTKPLVLNQAQINWLKENGDIKSGSSKNINGSFKQYNVSDLNANIGEDWKSTFTTLGLKFGDQQPFSENTKVADSVRIEKGQLSEVLTKQYDSIVMTNRQSVSTQKITKN